MQQITAKKPIEFFGRIFILASLFFYSFPNKSKFLPANKAKTCLWAKQNPMKPNMLPLWETVH